jgi:hypothetical protein
MKKIIFILIAITTISCGCKKYEEGPLINFRSAENRIYGYHVLKSITIDGEEHLNEYLDSLPNSFDYHYAEGSGNVCHIDGQRNDGHWASMWSSWKLINHNKILKITSSQGSPPTVCYGPFKSFLLPEWEILRLTNMEMKLKTIYEDKEYIILLESI